MEQTQNATKTSFYDFIELSLNRSLNQNTCFAAWRLPSEKKINIGLGEKLIEKSSIFNAVIKPSFVFSPFQVKDNHSLFEIKCLYSYENSTIISLFENEILSQANFNKNHSQSQTKKEEFISNVKKATESIKKGSFDKVVLSRVKKASNTPFGYLKVFQRLLNDLELSDSFISLTYTPQTGIWVGGTPEILLEQHNKLLKTVALAGTQKNTFKNIREAFWRQKEIEEQAYVSRYIINCFKKIRLREFEEIGPKTIQAGSLLHLKTEFNIDLEKTNYSELADTLIKLIHPTSAVCGMPLNNALDFILKHENYNRTYYAGYLGPIGIENKSSLFVNLRCAQFIDSDVYIYAGAGITEDSNPEKEWDETELKCETILKQLN